MRNQRARGAGALRASEAQDKPASGRGRSGAADAASSWPGPSAATLRGSRPLACFSRARLSGDDGAESVRAPASRTKASARGVQPATGGEPKPAAGVLSSITSPEPGRQRRQSGRGDVVERHLDAVYGGNRARVRWRAWRPEGLKAWGPEGLRP